MLYALQSRLHGLTWLLSSQNVLELMVHDEEHCLADVHLLTVLFDVSKIRLGETICLTFPLNPKVRKWDIGRMPLRCEITARSCLWEEREEPKNS